MHYDLEHLRKDGKLEQLPGNISYLAFCKHMTFAGLGNDLFPMAKFRYWGNFFSWLQHWNNSHFSIPTPLNKDPTEISYVSNRIGRAFADYFAKKLYGARFTHSYEDAMVRQGHKIKGKRPDFYCDNLSSQFAIEAKGKSKKVVTSVEMTKVKAQANSGPLKVNFSVASVSYNLYSSPKIKFHDPVGGDFDYDAELNMRLRSLYYSSILELLNQLGFDSESRESDDYYSYDIFPLVSLGIRLVLHRAIVDRDWYSNEWLEGITFSDNDDDRPEPTRYIDLDGIGLTMRPK